MWKEATNIHACALVRSIKCLLGPSAESASMKSYLRKTENNVNHLALDWLGVGTVAGRGCSIMHRSRECQCYIPQRMRAEWDEARKVRSGAFSRRLDGLW